MASSPLADTTSKTINGKDGTADFTIDNGVNVISYKIILDMIRVRELNEMTNADTFANEGTADQEPGRSQLMMEISGLGKKGGPASGPMIPAPQNVPVVATFSTGCTFSCSVNFTEASADRLVNQNCRIGGRCPSKQVYVVTWNRGSYIERKSSRYVLFASSGSPRRRDVRRQKTPHPQVPDLVPALGADL
jgi:hypothetical protein